ncbi:polysaccharide deacetylase family protein [Actinoplanes sp. NPDC049681]|uniref:polysaccharide deacetylase family protein n=1 Tax=Actinoplanes sp. NPDC049681 TaxID=3363905 RepID=UPI0037BE1DC4
MITAWSRRVAATVTLILAGVAASHPGSAAAAPATCARALPDRLTTTPATYPKTISLTFDDGPSAYTPQFLEVLKGHKVHGTFFLKGANVVTYPELARRIVREGHAIGNHTYSHPEMPPLSKAEQAAEMDRATAAIIAATGERPCLYRSPRGHATSTTQELAVARRMTAVQWTIDTDDWSQPRRPDKAFEKHIYDDATTTRNHPIILMHDGGGAPLYRGNTVRALDDIIRYYKSRGYVFTDPTGRRL